MLASALQVMRDDHSNSRITKWSLVCTHLSWSDLICFWKRGYSFTIHVNASSVPDVFHLWPIDQDGFGLRFSTPVQQGSLHAGHVFFSRVSCGYGIRSCHLWVWVANWFTENFVSAHWPTDRIYFSSWIGHWGSYAKGRENDLSNWYSELWFFSSSSSSSSLRIFCWFLLLFLFADHGELVPTSYPSHAFSFWSHGGRNGGWENILELTFLDIELVSDMHNTQSRKY